MTLFYEVLYEVFGGGGDVSVDERHPFGRGGERRDTVGVVGGQVVGEAGAHGEARLDVHPVEDGGGELAGC